MVGCPDGRQAAATFAEDLSLAFRASFHDCYGGRTQAGHKRANCKLAPKTLGSRPCACGRVDGVEAASDQYTIPTQCAACAAPLAYPWARNGRCRRATAGPNARCSIGKRVAMKSSAIDKKAGGAEQYNANQKYTAAGRGRCEKCRTTRRARLATSARRPSIGKQRKASYAGGAPRDGGVRARVVLGGAGEDFGRGG